jgi:threonine dehydratase
MKWKENLNDLEMSKKRNHKIVITDEAIKKVPRVEYKEIDQLQYDILQKLVQEVLLISKTITILMKLPSHTV